MKKMYFAAAAMAAMMFVGCSDKKNCCDAPRFSADADVMVMVQPQPIIKTALSAYSAMKDKLSESDVAETEMVIKTAQELKVEDVSWIALSLNIDSLDNRRPDIRISASYPHELAKLVQTISDLSHEEARKLDIAGAEAYEFEPGDLVIAKAGKVLMATPSENWMRKQVAVYTDGGSTTHAELVPTANGLATIKLASVRSLVKEKLFDVMSVNLLDSQTDGFASKLLSAGEAVLSLRTDGISLSVEFADVEGATDAETKLAALIAIGRIAYAQQKETMIENIPAELQTSVVPMIDKAVESISCVRSNRKVTLEVKADILMLADQLIKSGALNML